MLVGALNARSGVPDLQHDPSAAATRPHQHAAVAGIADRIGNQVAHDPLDQHRVGVHDVSAAAQPQRQSLLECGRLEVQPQPAQDLLDLERLRIDADTAGVDARDVEQFGKQRLERIDRFVDAIDELGDRFVLHLASQCLGEQAHRMQWLAQVVTGRGEELRLGPVGEFGRVARVVGCALLGSQFGQQPVRLQLEVDGTLQCLTVVACEQRRQAEDEQQDAGQLQTVGVADEHDAQQHREEAECTVGEEGTRLGGEHRHHDHAEGVDDDDQRGLLDGVTHRIQQPGAQAPHRARSKGGRVPPAAPALPVVQAVGLGNQERAVQPGAHRKHEAGRQQPAGEAGGADIVLVQQRHDDDADQVARKHRRHVVECAAHLLRQRFMCGSRWWRIGIAGQPRQRRGGQGGHRAHPGFSAGLPDHATSRVRPAPATSGRPRAPPGFGC